MMWYDQILYFNSKFLQLCFFHTNSLMNNSKPLFSEGLELDVHITLLMLHFCFIRLKVVDTTGHSTVSFTR